MDEPLSGLPIANSCCCSSTNSDHVSSGDVNIQRQIEAYKLHVNEAKPSAAALQSIASACHRSTETDVLKLFARLRRSPDIPMHGAEHHGLLAGVVVAAYRNASGEVSDENVIQAVVRANMIRGRACGYLGICGAAAAVGAAFSVIIDATPLRAERRQQVLDVVASIATTHAAQKAARCCQRECVLALKAVADLSAEHLPIPLTADASFVCEQSQDCEECAGQDCPLYPH
jgi:7,8-dihydro-6-hydroxymethylpterin dimethyltransferase